ncbi:MAG: methyltransferase domain-containing protein [Salinisphaera sp.]|nr:methyltransferase domain-containing protein [Salinisphaera sp.]
MDTDRIKAFADQVFDDMAGAMTAGLAYIGVEMGLFRAMAGKGPLTAQETADAAGLKPRHVAEWLKGMVSAGYLEYDSGAQTYTLPAEHAFLVASEGSDHFVGGLYGMVPPMLKVAPRVAQSFRDGGGVPFRDYGEEVVAAFDWANRGNYEHRLVDDWLSAMPDIAATLRDDGQALDVGCGAGHVSLALAKGFPESRFTGIDLDAGSVRQAETNARERGLAERVTFHATPVEQLDDAPGFDLITACDCIHDFADPITTLTAMRRRLKPGGALFVVEPKVADRLEDNCHSVATMFYGMSVFHCMSQSLAAGGPGLGTCMGPARTEGLLREAGFERFEQLPIKSRVSLFYRASTQAQ